MSPRLRVRSLLFENEEKADIYDLEEFKGQFSSGADTMIVVEGRVVNSFDELEKLVASQYRDKEVLDVMLLPVLEGG